MRNLAALAALLAILVAACTSGDKSSISDNSPTPVAAAATPAATPCRPDDGDNAPCPGTPVPVLHQPLPPPGPISDADVPNRVPPGLSEHDRKIVERVMRAQPVGDRQYVRWVFCESRIFVFSVVAGTGTASKVLNDDPYSKEHGGDFINFHNCIDFPMPGA
jgi:hypothetical protein